MTGAEAAAVNPQKPESLAGVFGVGLGLVIIALLVLTIVGYGPKTTTASSVLDGTFEVGELPEGLTLEPHALLLPTGERVVTIGNGAPLPVGPAELIDRSPGGGPGGMGGMGRGGGGPGSGPGSPGFEEYDWAGVEVKVEDSLPARLYLVNYPERRAPGVLTRQFSGLRWRDLSEISAKGGSAVIGGGKIEWSGYSADFVRQRRFIEGGVFRDTIRVNLSLGQECWIAYAIWPASEAGSERVVREVLAVLRPAVSDG